MADLADVEATLVSMATSVLYPNGRAASSILGVDCRIYRGWPGPAGLDADLKAGRVNVSIFPDSEPGKVTTRYPAAWYGIPAVPQLLASTSGITVSLDGTADVGQTVGVLVDHKAYVYRTLNGDTPSAVAANIAAIIRQDRIVRLLGSTLTIPGAACIITRVVADGSALQEIRRQSHDIRMSFWCPTPTLRDAAASVVDDSLASISFINLPDTSRARILYKTTSVFDQSQNAALYRRDLLYSLEYPTLLSDMCPSMVFGDLMFNSLYVVS